MTTFLWIGCCLFIYVFVSVVCMIAALEIDNYLEMYRVVHGKTFFYKFLYCVQTASIIFIYPLLMVVGLVQTTYNWLYARTHRT